MHNTQSETTSLYFGRRTKGALTKLDRIGDQFGKSRPQTIDFLCTYFEQSERLRSTKPLLVA